ncbi:alpha/beta fold hydrolase [Sporosarcina highlanderae]|uniref:Alpha/beta fold hydrolase n=1 Tax=Sporosarcina highlanderae TaxID=3035916 RepID=A0ABT8JQE2_9BACL|nr:alpha/beta fold hydrolase [Sporosarcina highlanderae]MDN4607386.1 alpha/beta fold hydrolase [Sporosarcina highlanderae]
MEKNEIQLEMSDGFKIQTVYAKPSIQPTAHIHLLHGMAEHIGRYNDFISFLVENGFAVSGHDHRGHGQTALLNGNLGSFGDSVGFDRIVEDAREVSSFYKKKFQAPRFILFGHSMGSFIARRYSQMFGNELDLLICSGTARDSGVSRLAGQALAKLKGQVTDFETPDYFINKLVFGSFKRSVPSPKTPFDWLSTKSETVENYINDPLCGFVPSTGFFLELFNGISKIHKREEIRKTPTQLPILLLSGVEDPVGEKGRGVWKVAHQLGNEGLKDITVMLYEGGRHEMLQEVNCEEVYDYIKGWIDKYEKSN